LPFIDEDRSEKLPRSILSISDLTSLEFFEILKRAKELKPQIKSRRTIGTLSGEIIGLFFEKPSTRTRASFETAIRRLSGESLYLSSGELQASRGEPIEDTARILGDYFDAVVARVNSHKTLEQLARFSGIPIVNALSDLEHPTQAISDIFTIFEIKNKLKGLKLAFVGDGNNVCNSLLLGSALVGLNMDVACPIGYEPKSEFLERAESIATKTGSIIRVVNEPSEAARESDAIYTDVWVSMGQEAEKQERARTFKGFQVNGELLRYAKPDALIMHCLPAHRGEEITEDVISSSNSVVWQQAENKLYGAAAVLEFILVRQVLERRVAPII
jgi:ornithine carbamoyltransferase